jgi:hypothetical protein
MGSWYTIGLCLGLGLAIGVILAGLLASTTVGASAATLVATAGGAVTGVLIGDTAELIAGGVAGFLGGVSAAVVVSGALRRGATRVGTAAYLGATGVLVILLALIPIVGYVEVVVVPLLAARMRGRQAARFAGLRTLAK